MFTVNPEIPADRQPYTLNAGRVGCLMLHGFMGSPKSSRPMAEFMQANGITMHCPLLPGHGHLPAKMHKVSHKEWIVSAETALTHLRQQCDEIFIIGHSMGCVLGAHLIKNNPDIRGFAMIAPLYKVPRKIIHLMAILRYVVPYLYPLKHKIVSREIIEGRVHDFDPSINLQDPEVQAWLNEGTKMPTSAVDEMRKMAIVGRKLWRKVNTPSLILQGGNDEALKPEFAQTILDALPTSDKQLRIFPDATHELMRPFAAVHQEVWQLIYQHISNRSSHLQTATMQVA